MSEIGKDIETHALFTNGNCVSGYTSKERSFHESFALYQVKERILIDNGSTQNAKDIETDKNLLNLLTRYCDNGTNNEKNKPFVIFGEKGVGKSHTLANWARQRKVSGEPTEKEFLFEYYVGCSRRSYLVTNFLYDFLVALKDFFKLKVRINNVENRLSSDFARYLEIAAIKGKVILVLDGIEKLVSNDGKPVALKWLPFNFPTSVRLICSCRLLPRIKTNDISSKFLTQAIDQDESNICDTIYKDTKARRWGIFKMERLDPSRIKKAILRYLAIEKTGLDNCLALAQECEGHRASNVEHSLTGNVEIDKEKKCLTLEEMHCFLEKKQPVRILESHVQKLSNSKTYNNLGMLFMLLRCIRLAADLNMDVYRLIDSCLLVESETNLTSILLDFFKMGNEPTTESIFKAWKAVKNNNAILMPRTNIITGLPSPETLNLRKNIEAEIKKHHNIIQTTVQSSDEKDNYSEDDFEDEEENRNSKVTDPYLKGLSHVPLYLLGGKPVDGIGETLIETIGLLENSRYGLTWTEIFAIIKDKIKKVSVPSSKPVECKLKENDLNDFSIVGLISVSKEIEANKRTNIISTSTISMLCRVLHCFGTLLVDNVMVLPRGNYSFSYWLVRKSSELSSSTPAGNVTNSNGDEGSTSTNNRWSSISKGKEWLFWKHILISFFEKLRPCMRKVEELIWLYEQCSEWTPLQKLLTDIPAFKFIWVEPRLRSDLIRYWCFLSMTVSEAGSHSFYHILADRYQYHLHNLNNRTHVEKDVETDTKAKTVPENDFTDENVRRYDPVEEYNKAVGKWKLGTVRTSSEISVFESHSSRRIITPSREEISNVISDLTEFFWELGMHETIIPRYFHSELSETRLSSLGLYLPHLNKEAVRLKNIEPAEIKLSGTSAALKNFNSRIRANINQLRYPAKDVAASSVSNTNSRKDLATKCHEFGIFVSKETTEAISMYSYRRWIWIQFPWLALAKARTAQVSMDQERATSTYTVCFKSRTHSMLNKNQESTARMSQSKTKQFVSLSRKKNTDNFWKRKKIDPNTSREKPLRPSMIMSKSKSSETLSKSTSRLPELANEIEEKGKETDIPILQNQEIGCRMLSTKEAAKREAYLASSFLTELENHSNSDHTLAKTYEDESPENEIDTKYDNNLETVENKVETIQLKPPAKQKNGFVAQVRHGHGPSSNKQLPPGVIPYSSPSIRTIHKGTRFPTFATTQKQNPALDQDKIFSGGYVTNFKGFSVDGHANTTAHLLYLLPAHMQGYPLTEQELRSAEQKSVLDRLVKEYNLKLFESQKKEDELEKIMRLASERADQDNYTASCIDAGESVIEDLLYRLELIKAKVEEAKNIGRYYKRIINVCEEFPAEEGKHMKFVESSLTNLRDEIVELELERNRVLTGIRKTRTIEIIKIQEALEERRKMHRDVISKLKLTRFKQANTLRNKFMRSANRESIAEKVQNDPGLKNQELWKLNIQKQLYQKLLNSRADSAQTKLSTHKQLFKRIQDATGVTDSASIEAKFLNAHIVTLELRNQVRERESRISKLNNTMNDYKAELNALKYGNDSVASIAMRKIDETVAHAETRLNRKCKELAKTEDILVSAQLSLANLEEMLCVAKKNQLGNGETRQDPKTASGRNLITLKQCGIVLSTMIEKLQKNGITLENITECTLTASRPEKKGNRRRSKVDNKYASSKSDIMKRSMSTVSKKPSDSRSNFLFGRVKTVEFPPPIVRVPTVSGIKKEYNETLNSDITAADEACYFAQSRKAVKTAGSQVSEDPKEFTKS